MKQIVYIFSVLILSVLSVYSQCSNCDDNYPTGVFSTSTTSLTTVSTCMSGGEYAYFEVTSGETYEWTTCGDSDFDTELTLFQGASCGGINLAYSDDDCGSQSTITWNATFTGTVTVLLSEYSCDNNSACMTLRWACTSCGGSTPSGDCEGALPFCTSDSYTFPASTNVPDMGSVGCLYTTPNPAWYWMQINQPGDIDIHISSGADVDFIAWGPFTSLSEACASDLMSNSGVDCSYSTAATETANITGTQEDEVYVLLITNYANVETNISFNQTGGTGTTNCGIIAPPVDNNGPLCEGETLELYVTTPEAGATYNWTGPNGFTSTSMEPVIPNVTTANAGTYSMTITIGSDTSDPVSTDVVISSNVTPVFTTPEPYCEGESVPALPTTSGNGITGSWSPSIDNTETTTYTFTPGAGQCALSTTLAIEITPGETPVFSSVVPYCEGEAIPDLPTISNNGISGSWSPAMDNTATTTYTFTPGSSECSTSTTLTIEITPQTVPVFDAAGPYCEGDYIPALPGTSNNGVSGNWSPAINNMSTTTYTFTPASGQCAASTTMEIEITTPVIPVFDPVGPFCAGTSISALPTVSNNGINGVWSPAINNTVSTEYTFTPNAGICAESINMWININENPVPVADNSGPVCEGSALNLQADPPGMSSYAWTGPNGYTSNMQTALITDMAQTSQSGVYTLLVEDSNGCTGQAETTVVVNPNPVISVSITDPLCADACNGIISISVSSATPPYSYSIDNGSATQDSGQFGDLCESLFYPWVEDDNGCVTSYGEVVLTDPEVLTLSVESLENQNCMVPGSAVLQAHGGTLPYTYHWPANANGACGNSANTLNAGTYVVSVSDHNMCEAIVDFEIENEGLLISTAVQTSEIICKGDNNGAILVTIQEGAPGFDISWNGTTISTMGTSYPIEGLTAGNYLLTISDNYGCQNTFNVNISEPSLALSSEVITENISCFGAMDGHAFALILGGENPYSIEWWDDQLISNSSSISNLDEGIYQLLVTDARGCQVDTTVVISQASPVIADYEIAHPSCIGNSDGRIEIAVAGGCEPYTFDWGMGTATGLSELIRLCEGNYNVIIEDAAGCKLDLGIITLIDIPEECIRIPDAFTPNGDNTNDTWIIENIGLFPNAIVQVFNRWGQILYTGKQGDEPWNGQNPESNFVPSGTYLYVIRLYNGSEPKTGSVTVIY